MTKVYINLAMWMEIQDIRIFSVTYSTKLILLNLLCIYFIQKCMVKCAPLNKLDMQDQNKVGSFDGVRVKM